MGRTSIEWTDHSINPIRARLNGRTGHYCEKVSPGCKHCYASRSQRRFGLPEFQEQRGEAYPFLDASKLVEVLRRRTPTRYFWCDMSDMFGDWVPDEWIAACFGAMAATPWHTHQVLTKRAKRMREWFEWVTPNEHGVIYGHLDEALIEGGVPIWRRTALLKRYPQPEQWRWPLPTVWLGVSAEDQPRLDERRPHLLRTPAAVRFLSLEPLLGPLALHLPTRIGHIRSDGRPNCNHCCNGDRCDDPTHIDRRVCPYCRGTGDATTVDWVIAGGESGPGARRSELRWFEDLRDQCAAAAVPFFLKQLGARAVDGHATCVDCTHEPGPHPLGLRHPKGGDVAEWPEDLRVRQMPC